MAKLETKYTEDYKLIVGKNDLLTWCNEHEELGETIKSEWDEELNGSMSNYKPGSGQKVWFKCSICGKAYCKSIKERVNNIIHEPCGRELGKQRLKMYFKENIEKEKTLAYAFPYLLDEWDYDRNSAEGFDPEHISYNSSMRVHWKCKECGKEYDAFVRNRTTQPNGCKACRKLKKNNIV